MEETFIDSEILRSRTLNFTLTSDVLAKISYSKDHFIEIRCIRIDGTCNMYETTWPDYGVMKMNGVTIKEFKPLLNNSSLKKRKDDTFTIKTSDNLREGVNYLTVNEYSANVNEKQAMRVFSNIPHCLSLCLVRRVSV